MIVDNFAEFADGATTVQQEAGTALIGDVYDLGATTRGIAGGQPLYLVITVDTAFDGGAGTAGTTSFTLASDAVAAIDTAGAATIHAVTDVFVADVQLTAGTTLVIPVPGGQTFERYLGILATQAVEGEDDGVISAFLTLDPRDVTVYPNATN